MFVESLGAVGSVQQRGSCLWRALFAIRATEEKNGPKVHARGRPKVDSSHEHATRTHTEHAAHTNSTLSLGIWGRAGEPCLGGFVYF